MCMDLLTADGKCTGGLGHLNAILMLLGKAGCLVIGLYRLQYRGGVLM